MLASGKSTRDIFEQMSRATFAEEQDRQDALQETQIDTTQTAKPLASRQPKSMEQYYAECNFESGTNSFSDFMQTQMGKHNMMLLPHTSVAQEDFCFYGKGRQMWQTSGDLRERTEDSFRFQLERSDRLQGFALSCDVASGHGALTSTLIEEFIKDDAPKAPVLLFALDG